MDREILGKPARLHNPRNESQMLVFQVATELSGHKKIIADFAAMARYPAVSFNESNNARRNGNRPGRAARFAANYADLEPLRSPAQAAIKIFHPLEFRLLRGDEGD